MLGRLVRRTAPLLVAVSAGSRAWCAAAKDDHYAHATNDLEILQILMRHTKLPVAPGLAASIVAHHSGDDAAVRALVDTAIARGADADSALLAAYRTGNQAMLSHLLKGRTAVPPDSIRSIVDGLHTRRRLRSAAESTGPLFARIREAAALGADPSAVNWRGVDPAIIDAIAMRDAELVGLLLELGADPAGVDFCERSALWHAIDKKHPEIVRLLIEAAAKHATA